MRDPLRKSIDVREAKTHLSQILEQVEAGCEIAITRGGRPRARLVPFERTGKRRLGCDAGLVAIAADFDAPLPDDVFAGMWGQHRSDDPR